MNASSHSGPWSAALPRWVLLALLTLGLAHSACGAVTLTVGTHRVQPGTAPVRVPVLIAGGQPVSEMAAVVLVNGGGLLLGGLPGPGIVAIDFADSIWGSGDAERVVFGAEPGGAQFAEPSVALRTAGRSVSASGLAFSLVLDVAGLPAGQYSIALGSSDPAIGVSRLYLAGVPVPVTLNPGSLEIAGSEPAVFRVSLVRLESGRLALRFPTAIGRTYRVQSSTSVTPAAWTSVSEPLAGTGSEFEWPIPEALRAASPQRFFRIESTSP